MLAVPAGRWKGRGEQGDGSVHYKLSMRSRVLLPLPPHPRVQGFHAVAQRGSRGFLNDDPELGWAIQQILSPPAVYGRLHELQCSWEFWIAFQLSMCLFTTSVLAQWSKPHFAML